MNEISIFENDLVKLGDEVFTPKAIKKLITLLDSIQDLEIMEDGSLFIHYNRPVLNYYDSHKVDIIEGENVTKAKHIFLNPTLNNVENATQIVKDSREAANIKD